VVFTDCPPGPGERENRQERSSGGIAVPRTLTAKLSPLIARHPPCVLLTTASGSKAGSCTARLRARPGFCSGQTADAGFGPVRCWELGQEFC
jgi:hypothetical protein